MTVILCQKAPVGTVCPGADGHSWKCAPRPVEEIPLDNTSLGESLVVTVATVPQAATTGELAALLRDAQAVGGDLGHATADALLLAYINDPAVTTAYLRIDGRWYS